MNQHITLPAISVGVGYSSSRLARLYAAVIITGNDGRALGDKGFTDHLNTLTTRACASYIAGHAIKPTADSPDGFEKLTVFLSEMPESATNVVVVGYVLTDETDQTTLGNIHKLTVTIDSTEDDSEEVYASLTMNDEEPQTTHLTKILCEFRRADNGIWELRQVDKSVSSNEVINRKYGVLLDL
jgi:hypothetical protein